MTPYEALYGRPCRSPVCWTKVEESSTTGPELIRVTSEKVDLIRKRLLTAQSRQKSYVDTRRRPLEFEVGDHVFLKVMPKRGVIKFGKRGKLSPRYIRPFEVLERVGIVAYRLALPPSLSSVHDVFHVSMLRKYTPYPTHVVDWGELVVENQAHVASCLCMFLSIFRIPFFFSFFNFPELMQCTVIVIIDLESF